MPTSRDIRLIADVSGMNIVASEDVKAAASRATEVPWTRRST
jgi:hypothetical protein